MLQASDDLVDDLMDLLLLTHWYICRANFSNDRNKGFGPVFQLFDGFIVMSDASDELFDADRKSPG